MNNYQLPFLANCQHQPQNPYWVLHDATKDNFQIFDKMMKEIGYTISRIY